MNLKITIIGNGSHAKNLAALLLAENRDYEITFCGPDAIPQDGSALVIGVGNIPEIGKSALTARQRIYWDAPLHRLRGYFSPSASIIGDVHASCQIMPHAVINPGANVMYNAIINTGAIIEHDSVIGPHSHIAPGAVLCGAVSVGKCVHVGANATVLPGVVIGDDSVIGAGVVVRRDVKPGETAL